MWVVQVEFLASFHSYNEIQLGAGFKLRGEAHILSSILYNVKLFLTFEWKSMNNGNRTKR